MEDNYVYDDGRIGRNLIASRVGEQVYRPIQYERRPEYYVQQRSRRYMGSPYDKYKSRPNHEIYQEKEFERKYRRGFARDGVLKQLSDYKPLDRNYESPRREKVYTFNDYEKQY